MRLGKLHVLLAGLSMAAANINAAPVVRACPTSGAQRNYWLVEVKNATAGTDCTTLTTQLRAYESPWTTPDPKTNDIAYILDSPPLGTAAINITADTDGCAKRDNGDTDVDEFMTTTRDGRANQEYHGHTQVFVNNNRALPSRFAPSAYMKANLKKNGVKFNRVYFLNDAGAGAATSKKVCKITDALGADRFFCRVCGDPKENDD